MLQEDHPCRCQRTPWLWLTVKRPSNQMPACLGRARVDVAVQAVQAVQAVEALVAEVAAASVAEVADAEAAAVEAGRERPWRPALAARHQQR